MNRVFFVASALVGVSLGIVGCSSDGSPNGGSCPGDQVRCDGVCIDIESTLEGANGIQEVVFDVSCAAFRNCHGGEGIAQAGLELSSAEVSQANLVDFPSTQVPGRARVESGNSDNSYLMDKIRGENLAPDTSRMPIGDVLCDQKVTAIENWINDLPQPN